LFVAEFDAKMAAPETTMARYRCLICQYVYNEKTEGIPFDDLATSSSEISGNTPIEHA
jgi:rubredoxin